MNKNSKNIRNELIKMEYRSCCSNMIYMTEENKSVLQKVFMMMMIMMMTMTSDDDHIHRCEMSRILMEET